LSFDTEQKERFIQSGWFQLAPFSSQGKMELDGMRLAALKPYYEKDFAGDIKNGLLDFATSYLIDVKSGDSAQVKLTDVNATLRDLRLDQLGRSDPLWILPQVTFKGGTLDLAGKTIVIDKVEARDGNGFAEREADGRLSYYRLLRPSASPQAVTEPAKQPGPDWRVDAKQIAFDRFKVQFEDHVPATPVTTRLSELSLRIDNYSTAKNQRSKAVLQTRINNKGQARLAGVVGQEPLIGNFAVTATDVEVVPFQPYFESEVLFLLTGGQVNTEGKLAIDGTGAGPTKVNYEGNVALNEFGAVDRSGSQDLFKWKALGFNSVQFALEPMQMRIGEITLSDFYTRLVLGADGNLNLTKLLVQKDAAPEVKETGTTKPPASAPQTPPANEKLVSIGKIALQGGQIDFSDFFVKPNYNANLTSVQGTISELKPDLAGDVAVTAKVQSSAPVDISGKINPLAKNLFLDIVADAREIELQPLSPYSGKYVGYDIEKGQLSFKVKYKLEDRRLQAENKITLNQLTFGNKVESPEATKLPVLLAVALLKDRNGVIDVNLPISGSLDDPQFSVGGIIWQIIGNILLKAVTSPFALLGAAFGGGGEELSYIEFDYGLAVIPQNGEAKIKNLVTAMNDRPGVKLDIAGRVDPVNDLEGLKKALIERKVKAQKLKDLVRQGNAPGSVDQVQVGKEEYEKYLKAAYGDESFEKPRNMIGLARDLPASEMEALMLKNTKVSDEDLRDLGSRRAQAVRDRLLAAGIPAERLFIVAPKPVTDAEKEKTKLRASRVDFSLR
jgi:hypothetical protein